MSKLFIHCGAHKTGTTLIQTGLRRHANDLHSRGILYLEDDARRIADVLHDFGISDREKTRLLKQILLRIEADAPIDNYVISHESFFSNADLVIQDRRKQFYGNFANRLSIFTEALENRDATLIFYVRRQDRFIESIYLEAFQGGYVTSDFHTYYSKLNLERLSWLSLIRSMQNCFAKDKIIIRPFEDINRGSQEFFQSFLQLFCQCDGLAIPSIDTEHRSLSAPGYRLLKHIYSLPFLSDPKSASKRRIVASPIRRYMSNRHLKKITFLQPQQRDEILRLHSDENEKMFAEFMPEWPRDLYSH